MNNSKWTHRWYDKDPTMSLAVSILRNTNVENQNLVADFIIQKITEQDIPLSPKVEGFLSMFKSRWYDENRNLSRALEHLKETSFDVQKEIALDMISYIYKLDNSVEELL